MGQGGSTSYLYTNLTRDWDFETIYQSAPISIRDPLCLLFVHCSDFRHKKSRQRREGYSCTFVFLVFFSFYLVLFVVSVSIVFSLWDLLVLFFSFSFTHVLPHKTTGDLYSFFLLFLRFFTLLCISAISLGCS